MATSTREILTTATSPDEGPIKRKASLRADHGEPRGSSYLPAMAANSNSTLPTRSQGAPTGTRIDLRNVSTLPPDDIDKERAKNQARAYGAVIGELTEKFFADGRFAMLIIFQGMDASGKDGSVRAAFGQSSPINTKVTSWQKPTELEMRHDFLWRIHKEAPARGDIAIWNRSHYEDVLVQRVHRWVDEATIDKRFAAINDFERNLRDDSNTIILKFLLHTSKQEQEHQLRERLVEPDKHFKHNPNDWKEREHWEAYMDAYNDVIARSEFPWIIVPTDKRWYRDYAIARAVRDALEDLSLEWPPLPAEA